MKSIPVFSSPQGEVQIKQAYQTVLGQWPVPYRELQVITSFGDTHVIVSGPEDGHPVVLLHALLASAVSWIHNVEALSLKYRVYAVDVIGEGNKSCPVKPIQSLDDFLQWFTELIGQLQLDDLSLVGNSYGGFTAAYFAMKLPERVRKLVLVAPAATIYRMTPFYIHMFIPKGLYLFFPKLPGRERAMRRSVDWMHAGLPPDPLWEPLFYRNMMFGSLINQALPRVYTKEEFAQIRAPVLLILGKKEVIYNPRRAIQAAKELIPGLQVELVPDAHHIAALARPEIVNKRLLQFLAE